MSLLRGRPSLHTESQALRPYCDVFFVCLFVSQYMSAWARGALYRGIPNIIEAGNAQLLSAADTIVIAAVALSQATQVTTHEVIRYM